MKKLYLTTLILFSLNILINAQSYYSFPTDTARWNCVYEGQAFGPPFYYLNYQYLLKGDTAISGLDYKKVFFRETDSPENESYIGGLREDENKNIYFYPTSQYLDFNSQAGGRVFPNNTSEHLLYTFNNLVIDSILPINSENESQQIQVYNIDSVLIGLDYRKRYWINQSNLLGEDYWIEGIGSAHDLLAPFADEFEWTYKTLCYTDSITYNHIQFYESDCYVDNNIKIDEVYQEDNYFFPNPTTGLLTIKNATKIEIYNCKGVRIESSRDNVIDVTNFNNGIYIVKIYTNKGMQIRKLIKE